MKKNEGVFKRFVICLVVYAMLSTAIITVLIKIFPNGFSSVAAKLLIVGAFVILFIVGFTILEYIRAKKGR